MSPAARRLNLLAHVVTSVGWLGAVVTSLGLGVIGLASIDGRLVQGAYVTMEALGWAVLVPFSLLSLATGLVQALGTRWGLLRHYWVLVKLAMNLLASLVLVYKPAGRTAYGRRRPPGPATVHTRPAQPAGSG